MLKQKVVVADVAKKYDNPISQLVQVACHFSSEINLLFDGHKINAKSMMGIMALCPREGVEMDIETSGADENQALNAMSQFLKCV